MLVADKRYYGDDEAEQILKLASRKEHASGSISRDQLLASAAELGISAESLAEAEREYRDSYQKEEDRKEFDKQQRGEFLGHAVAYVCVNCALMFMDLRKDGQLSWAFWPVLMWGMGLFYHGLETYGRMGEDYKKNFEKWRRKKHREEEMPDLDTDFVLDSISSEIDVEKEKIEAIKRLRQQTGLGLKDAKDAVEDYIEQRS